MKVYTQEFICETPVGGRFYCPPNSMFKVGVKVLKGGEELSGVTLSSGGQALSADEDKYFGWTTWTIQSQGPGSTEYVVGASGTEQKFKIQQVASDGTVFDMDATGGAVPADVATQGYVQDYVAGEISDLAAKDYVQEYVAGEVSGLATQEEADEIESQLSAKRYWDDLTYWQWRPGNSVGLNGFQLALDGQRTVDMLTFEHGAPGQDSVWRDPDDSEYQVRTVDFVTFRLTDSTGQQTLFQFQPSGREPQEEWDVTQYIPGAEDASLRIDIAQTNLATIEDITVMVGLALNQINY